ncbi:hypothetical protein LTR36_002742 [Oleoguttula mirabilis]|uniref:Uncharacterized protein n=1 Tax=Oleoguttula mirabilis TaxID=1507867 RepID=A0AAV9JK14_9PEZI|nr:hypothetical protein LTR36_002742 [Oleoguttula mirabilis]
MPKLKQLTCAVELGASRTKLKEYGARYSDGVVETFIAVPDTQVPFCVHVQSEGYIAPGLAVFVFMDGQYQCNRNKLRLAMPSDDVPPTQYEVDFCMRQKEEKTAGGTFVGRDWSFAQLDTSTADNAASLNPNFVQNVGTIEIVILRCSSEGEQVPTPNLSFEKPARDVSKSRSTRASAHHSRAPSAAQSSNAKNASEPFGGLMGGLFDGACDEPEPLTPHKKACKGLNIRMPTEQTHDIGIGGFDGAYDDSESMQAWRPVGKGGRINEDRDSESILTWDSCMGEMIPRAAAAHSTAHYERKERAAPPENHMPSDQNRDDRTDIHNAGHKHAQVYTLHGGADTDEYAGEGNTQLDGHGGGQPQVVINNYGKDDMDGDKYLGVEGDNRNRMKGRFRDQGVSVTASIPAGRHDDLAQGYRHVPGPNEQYQFAQKGYQPAYELPHQQYHQAASVEQPGYQAQPEQPKEIDPLQVPAILEKLVAYVQQLRQQTSVLEKLATNAQPTDLADINEELGHLALQDRQCVSRYNELKRTYKQYLQKVQAAQGNVAGQQLADQAQALPQAQAQPGLQDYYKQAAQANVAGQQLADQAQAFPQAQAQPGLQDYYKQAAVANNRWVQAGEGVVGGGARLNKDWQMPQEEQQPYGHAGNQAGHGKKDSKGGDGGNGWGQEKRTTSQWGDGQQNGKQNGNRWDDNKSHKSTRNKDDQQNGGDNAWGNDAAQNNQNNGQWGVASNAGSKKEDSGWGDNGGQAGQAPTWGNDNAAQPANDNWGGTGDQQDNKPKTVANDWADGGQQNQISGTNDQAWGASGSQRAASAAASLAGNFDTMSVSSKAGAKSYWADWRHSSASHESSDPNTKRKREVARSVYDYPSSPLPAVPADKVRGASHGVQVGRGADYAHRCHRPKYLDTMTAPYAVFSFKYRSKTALEKILKRSIDADIEPIVRQAEKDKLMNMPRSKLIEELMKARNPQGASRSVSARGASVKAPSAAGWGAPASEKKSVAGGWAGDAGVAGNNNNDNDNNGWGAQKSSHGGKSQAGGNNGWGAQSQKSAMKKSGAQDGGWANTKSNSNGNGGGGWGGSPANNGGGNDWKESTPAAAGGWDGGNDSKSKAGGRNTEKKSQFNAGGWNDTPSKTKPKSDVKRDDYAAVTQTYDPPKDIGGWGAWERGDAGVLKVLIGNGGSLATGFSDRGERVERDGDVTQEHGFEGFERPPSQVGGGDKFAAAAANAVAAAAAVQGRASTLGSGAGGQGMAAGGKGGMGGLQPRGGRMGGLQPMGGGMGGLQPMGAGMGGGQAFMDAYAMYGGGGAGGGGRKAGGGVMGGAQDLLQGDPMARHEAGGVGKAGPSGW